MSYSDHTSVIRFCDGDPFLWLWSLLWSHLFAFAVTFEHNNSSPVDICCCAMAQSSLNTNFKWITTPQECHNQHHITCDRITALGITSQHITSHHTNHMNHITPQNNYTHQNQWGDQISKYLYLHSSFMINIWQCGWTVLPSIGKIIYHELESCPNRWDLFSLNQ